MSGLAEVFATGLEDLTIFRYTALAALTCLVYDYMLTLNDEIRLVWSSRFSAIKCVYFLNRGIAFLAAFLQVYLLLIHKDANTCKAILYATAVSDLFIFIIGEIVLFMRVYATWFCSKIMLGIFALAYIPGHTGALYDVIRVTRSAITEPVSIISPGSNGCIVIYTSKGFWICYVILLFHESLMLFLLLLRAVRSNGFAFTGLFELLIKDGIFYYVCVFALSMINLFVLLFATENLRVFFIIVQAVLHSMLCARLLLRLRGAYHQLTSEGLRSAKLRSGWQAASTTLVQSEDIPLSVFSETVPSSHPRLYEDRRH